MKTTWQLGRLALIVALAVAGCAAPTPAAPALQKIRLPMGFIPSVQYASFYVAQARGFFREAGFEVEFDHSFETDGVKLVAANELPFAVVSGEQVLLARAQGLPVVYAMAWFQKFPVAVMAKAEAGINTPADLRGKRIGVPLLAGASYIGLRALMAAAGIAPEEVTVQEIGFNQVEALSAGRVDAVVVYTNNEPIRLAAQGERLSVLPVSDYASLAANGLLTNETMLKERPDDVRRFVQAVVRGIQAVIDDPAAAYAVSKTFAPDALTDDALEQQVLAATIELWKAERLGQADPAAWETMQTTLLEAGLLQQPLALDQAFTNAFVP